MKTFLTFALITFTFSSFAAQVLECGNENTQSLYKLAINDRFTIIKMTPLIDDQTPLSSGKLELFYAEGESSENVRSYGGKNQNGNIVALEINSDLITYSNNSKMSKAVVYFTESNPNYMTGKLFLNCLLK